MCVEVLHGNYSAQSDADGKIAFRMMLVNMLCGREVIVQNWPDLLTGFVVTTEHQMQGNDDSILLPNLGPCKIYVINR
jgi:hypothetical protein